MLKSFNLNLSAKILLYWYALIFFSTEFLSNLHFLERKSILLVELLFWIVLLSFNKRAILYSIQNINIRSRGTLVILFLFALTFIQGFFSAPNTTDSMVYHLPRVMYWIQEKTVTQDVIRNLHDFMAPFGEYILLHLYLITGNDRLLFLSQWLAYIVSVILTGIIAKQLGANEKVRMLTQLFVATIPMAVMQATSTQVDMIVSVLVMIGTHISFNLLKEFKLKNLILFGLTVGLGIATKATFFIYLIIPAGIVILAIIKNGFRNILPICLSGVIALAIPLRFMTQNLNLYGNILGPFLKGQTLTNDVISIEVLISNLLKNLMIHIPVPFFNNQVQSFIVLIHQLIDIPINSSQTTCCDFQFNVIPVIFPQEDIVSNPLQLIIFIFTLFSSFRRKILKNKVLFLVYILNFLSFIIFSLILKWQPFHSRLQIPFFMLGTISSVLILSNFKKGLFFLKSMLYLSIPLALLVVFLNISKPFISYILFYNQVKHFAPPLSNVPEAFYLKSREVQYFNPRFYWYYPYKKIIDRFEKEAHDEKTVTFKLMDFYEYPLWLLMKEKNISFKVLPESKILDDTIIISTSKEQYSLTGYTTECIKTEIEYGYACISIK